MEKNTVDLKTLETTKYEPKRRFRWLVEDPAGEHSGFDPSLIKSLRLTDKELVIECHSPMTHGTAIDHLRYMSVVVVKFLDPRGNVMCCRKVSWDQKDTECVYLDLDYSASGLMVEKFIAKNPKVYQQETLPAS